MSDEELIARLRDEHVAASRTEAADRIEALRAEVEAQSLDNARLRGIITTQGAAMAERLARAEAAEAEVEKLVKERDEALRRRDAWKSKAEGYDAVRNALREKVGAPWPPNLSRAMWAGIAADEKKRADDAKAVAEKLRGAALKAERIIANGQPDKIADAGAILRAALKGADHE